MFINLVNNSRYWVKETKEERRIIRLDVLDGLIYVSDNGPGVDPDDVSNFSLYFSPRNKEVVAGLAFISANKI